MMADELLNAQDLITAKKHDTFHSEVITGKAGGVSTGANIDYATNAVTGQVQKTLPKILDDLDWSYVGKFADGVTFTDKTDFAVDAVGTQWIYTGSLPFSATAGTVPSEPDYQVVHVKSASAISNANGGSVQDFIDAQYTTVAELATGKFHVGHHVRLTDRAMGLFLVQSGGTADGFGTLDAGNGNTAVYVADDGEVHVNHFGAKADGVTDDTAAVQAAIDSMVNGGTLRLEGEILITGVSVDYEHVTLQGSSTNTKLLVADGATGITFLQHWSSMRDITVESVGSKNDGKGTNGVLFNWAEGNSVGYINLFNVEIRGFSGYGIKAINTLAFLYQGGYVVSCDVGISFVRDAGRVSFGTTAWIQGVYVTSCRLGIFASYLYRSSFIQSVFEDCSSGIWSEAGDFTVERCYFERNISHGLKSENTSVVDIDNYKSPATNNQFDIGFTSAILPANRGYRVQNGDSIALKTLRVMAEYGVDEVALRAIGKTVNTGLRYGSNAVVLNKGANLIKPELINSNRLDEVRGWDSGMGGWKIQGSTSVGTEGITVPVDIVQGVVYVLDWSFSVTKGSAPSTVRVGTQVVSNGVPFTATGNGTVNLKLFGNLGTPYEIYVTSLSLSRVDILDTYEKASIGQDRINRQVDRGYIEMSTAPSTGAWGVGEKVWNSSPASGQPIGWVCTTGGSPGTWLGFGIIA